MTMAEESKSSKALKLGGEARARVEKASGYLYTLGDAFYITGNVTVGQRLVEMAYELEKAAQQISDASGLFTSELLLDAQQGSANVLEIAMALAKPEKPDEP
jgi:hypothetical protein